MSSDSKQCITFRDQRTDLQETGLLCLLGLVDVSCRVKVGTCSVRCVRMLRMECMRCLVLLTDTFAPSAGKTVGALE